MGAETERVHWFTEGCWTGMCFPKTLSDAKKHDLETGTRARRVTSSQRFCSGTGLSWTPAAGRCVVPPHPPPPLSSKTTRRTESPPVHFCPTQQSAYLEFQGQRLRRSLLVFIAQNSDPAAKSVRSGRMSNKEGPAASTKHSSHRRTGR